MSSDEKKLIFEVSNRRQKRVEAKKRKAVALLQLFAETEADEEELKRMKRSIPNNKSTIEAIQEEVKLLKEVKSRLNEKIQPKQPFCELTESGVEALVDLESADGDKSASPGTTPLFVEDVQHLLLKALVGSCSKTYTPRWCKIGMEHLLNHVVLFVIDGISKDVIVQNASYFTQTTKIFSDIVELLTPDSYSLNFADELCGVHLSLSHRLKGQNLSPAIGICNSFKPLANMFPTEATASDGNGTMSCTFSRLHLLLSPIQLVMESFPLPRSVFDGSKSDGYCFTKDSYSPVTATSPLFALDCEMCRMTSGRMEVTRIAIINEDYNVIYNTLVKPNGEVSDYLTRYSGVTKDMLDLVTVSLKDVQEDIRKLLPGDAILCGQSLNFDLHALQMIHPYVIDTSVIYNISGNRIKKASLKLLSQTFLKEAIQEGEGGHNPIEDCIAAMKLVKLKLQNGPQFGDAILSGHKIFEKSKNQPNTVIPNNVSNNFFSKLRDLKKSVCIVATEDTLAKYPKYRLTDNVRKCVKPGRKKIMKQTLKSMTQFNFTISHVNIKPSELNPDVFMSIDNSIKQLYGACVSRTLVIVVATGLGIKKKDVFENGLCMVKIKL